MGEWSDFPSETGGTLGDWNQGGGDGFTGGGGGDSGGGGAGWDEAVSGEIPPDSIGAGGDPFGGDGSDFPSDAATTGMLPGGADGQLTPFSPGGGFDITNAIAGLAGGARARPAGYQQAWWMGGAGGSGAFPGGQLAPGRGFFGQGGDNLGVMPMPAPPGSCQPTTAQRVGLIVRGIRARTGLRISARSLVGLIVKYGFQPAAALTGAAPGDLLFVFFAAKGVRHHRRGPGLYTIGRKLRAADRLRKRVGHILGRQMHRVRGYVGRKKRR